jgi:signal transduction histidine kinase/DNA-binding response OmpR family regulator
MANRTMLNVHLNKLNCSFFFTAILSFGHSWTSDAQDSGFKYDHCTIEDGLSHGLNRVDDYAFMFYENIQGFETKEFIHSIIHEQTNEKTISSDNISPIVHIIQIKTNNQEFLNPSSLNTITLDYLTSFVSFEFAAFGFLAPHKSQYAHQLEGFDKEWIYSGNESRVTYAHLDPGKYTFKVKASNNYGIWIDEGVSIDMVILPPPWRTWWAYLIYVLSGLIFLSAARYEILRNERLKSSIKLKEMEAEKYHELNTIKSCYFANISHEFRTPLSLLLCPIEKWLSKATDPQLKTDLKIMHRNASRLLTLVNQLLELSRLEAGTLKLRAKSADLTAFIRYISCQFSSMANYKNIDFKVRSQDHINLYFDHDKLQKVIVNLLSNAFKFTGEGGSIQIDLNKADKDEEFPNGCAEIRISDNGMGINVEHLTKIFDRFYQSENSLIRHYEGSGIGLALAKELVELHHGSIGATSVEGEGSSFIVRLPLGSSHLTPEELSDSHEIEVLSSASLNIHPLMEKEALEEMQGNGQARKIDAPRILIVDDNEDFRCYLRCNLALQYDVMEATDGVSGLATALKEIPDLVISDIMMPTMDGFEMCKRIKHDERTSHIPVILLTAKADQPSIINGIGIGADDFISKPFHAEELIVRIKNVIEIRKKLKQKFSKQMILMPSEIKADSLDTKFLKKVISIIEEHLDDNLLHVDMLSKEANMSSIQLNRKLKALTGSTPNDIIRNIRLQRAASLLEQNAGNVAEVAFSVGFNNLSYFSKCFREKFNSTPHEFRKIRK